jgi:hypothetical protein
LLREVNGLLQYVAQANVEGLLEKPAIALAEGAEVLASIPLGQQTIRACFIHRPGGILFLRR